MLRRTILTLAGFALLSPLHARINVNTEFVRSSIVFIYASTKEGVADENRALGTGFLVSIPLKSNPTRVYVILVTARHVLEPQWASCEIANPTRVHLRLNRASYDPAKDPVGVGFVPLPLVINGQRTFHVPKDDELDIAVVVLEPELFLGYEVGIIPVTDFATSDEIKTRTVGDDILATGLIPLIPGKRRNYAFFKFGKISNSSEEVISVPCEKGRPPKATRVWFIACNLVPGNSGAPVWAYPFGPVAVHMGSPSDLMRPVLIGVQSSSLVTADLAGMTPINYVLDVLTRMNLPDADLYRGDPAKRPTQNH